LFRSRVAFLILIVLTLTVLGRGFSQHPRSVVQATSIVPTLDLPPMNLTIMGTNGTLILNSTDIGNLPSYSGYGGLKNQIGTIKNYGNYTGISLIVLCNLVGGIQNNDTLRITAWDNYTMNFSYDQVNGNFTTFDNVTGSEVQHNQSLTPIIAYYFNGQNVPSADGPLRLAIVGPEQGLVTTSAYWVKLAAKIEVLSPAIPEFPISTVMPVLMTVTIVAVWALRKKIRSLKISSRQRSSIPSAKYPQALLH
jgi:hypothetical protein